MLFLKFSWGGTFFPFFNSFFFFVLVCNLSCLVVVDVRCPCRFFCLDVICSLVWSVLFFCPLVRWEKKRREERKMKAENMCCWGTNRIKTRTECKKSTQLTSSLQLCFTRVGQKLFPHNAELTSPHVLHRKTSRMPSGPRISFSIYQKRASPC